MASGCILRECPVCNELIWEDEWDMVGDVIVHLSCKRKYRNINQDRTASDDAQRKREIQDIKDILEYCTKRIDILEKESG